MPIGILASLYWPALIALGPQAFEIGLLDVKHVTLYHCRPKLPNQVVKLSQPAMQQPAS